MNLKTIYTRGLAMFLSLVMIIGTLSLPALAADAEPLPDLTPPTEEELETAPTDQAYKDPFDEAKEADQLDGEKLDAVNKEIEDAVDTANQEIGEANAAADAAAAEEQLICPLVLLGQDLHLQDAVDIVGEPDPDHLPPPGSRGNGDVEHPELGILVAVEVFPLVDPHVDVGLVVIAGAVEPHLAGGQNAVALNDGRHQRFFRLRLV